jgi:hypothetical protein
LSSTLPDPSLLLLLSPTFTVTFTDVLSVSN